MPMVEPGGNDNIRTRHLKCGRCGVQVFFNRIDRIDSSAEVRVFGCRYCGQTQEIRLPFCETANRDDRSSFRDAETG